MEKIIIDYIHSNEQEIFDCNQSKFSFFNGRKGYISVKLVLRDQNIE